MSSESTASAGGYHPGVGAIAFWLPAAVSTLLFAADMAQGLAQFAGYALIGLIIVMVLIGAPAVGVLLNPRAARGTGAAWRFRRDAIAEVGGGDARYEPETPAAGYPPAGSGEYTSEEIAEWWFTHCIQVAPRRPAESG